MRKLQYIFTLFCMLAFLPACSNDDDNTGEPTALSSKIADFDVTNYSLPEAKEGVNPYLFRMNWTKSRFFAASGEPVFVEGINYEVEADLVDNNFSKAVTVVSTKNLYTDIYTETLRQLLVSLVGEENEDTQTISLRVKATGNDLTVYSDPVLLVITPFVPIKEVPNVFIIGDMNGWNNGSTDFIMFRNDNNVESGVYTYTGNFGAGCWLKFCGEQYLGSYDNLYSAGANGVLELGKDKGAFYIEGFATITIDIVNMTWKIEAYDASAAKSYTGVGPIGDFCAWDNEPLMSASTFDPHQWNGVFTFDNSTTVKFRGDRNWANNWGAQAADIPFGKAVFDGPGATAPAGKYRIYFNDLTGHYVIKKQVD
ncbi:MAG: SusE domain-containing protein [Dysgonomonas sp.]